MAGSERLRLWRPGGIAKEKMAELAFESERGRRLLPPIEETGRRGISGRSPVALKFKLERRPTIIK